MTRISAPGQSVAPATIVPIVAADVSAQSASNDNAQGVSLASSNEKLLQEILAANQGALKLLATNVRDVKNAVTGATMNTITQNVGSEWDTGMQAITELKLRTGHAAVPEMIRYVCSLQLPDGGWKDAIGDETSGPTASLINHAALVAYYKHCLETSDTTHFALVDDALKKSWQHWTGKVPAAEKLLNPLPTLKTLKAAPFGLMYYYNVFPPLSTRLPLGKILAAFVPSAPWAAKYMKKKGMMPQLQDFLYGSVLTIAPKGSLDTKKLETYRDYLLKTRGEGGLFCYLPMLTGLAVMALDRQDGQNPATRSLIDQSLEASRALYSQGTEGVRVSAYSPDAFYAIDYTMARLIADPSLAADPETLGLIDYILACRATTGLFQQSYRADEADDGLLYMTGKVLQLTGFLNYLAAAYPPLLDQLPEFKARFDQLNAMAPELVQLLAAGQNKDGGFATFRKTDVSKKPGAMKNTALDSSTAVSTGFILGGLAAAGQNAENSDVMRRGLEWLRADFKPGAGWWSRFGGGYLSGNATAIAALKAAGVDVTKDAQIQEVVHMLQMRQHPDGSWGENAHVADNPKADVTSHTINRRGHPVLTAYALMTLLNAGVSPTHLSVQTAAQYLLRQYNDPSAVLEKLKRNETVSFADLDAAGWSNPYALTTFSPPKYGWYVADETLADLHPVLALQQYYWALKQAQAQSQ